MLGRGRPGALEQLQAMGIQGALLLRAASGLCSAECPALGQQLGWAELGLQELALLQQLSLGASTHPTCEVRRGAICQPGRGLRSHSDFLLKNLFLCKKETTSSQLLPGAEAAPCYLMTKQ